jgi:hypothetical protein
MVSNLDSLLESADEFSANFISFLIAIAVMYTVNHMFAIALLAWFIIFFGCSIWFSNNIHTLSKKKDLSLIQNILEYWWIYWGIYQVLDCFLDSNMKKIISIIL